MRKLFWLLILPLCGCTLPAPEPPSAEFLVADGSSTYWVKSGRTGIHARVSPLILTKADGRYYEVFVGESTRSYADAVFSAEPIYRRDLVTGDSSLVWEDAKITAWEQAYLARNPTARLLAPGDDPNDDVALSATGEADILGALGPYLLYTHRSTLENATIERADTARGVIDLRIGKPVSLTVLVNDTAALSGGGIREHDTVRWRHAGYDLVARFDSTRGQTQMVIRDLSRREWTLGYVDSRVPRIFWLDEPRLDARVLAGIAHAFEGALSDEGTSQLVSRDRLNRAGPSRGRGAVRRPHTLWLTARDQ
jgi:hypothetical protein